ncbi:MAG: DUF3502 domain-containing protein [Clostridiaceae bacterium]
MRTKLRKLLLITLTFVLVLSNLAGCAGGSKTDGSESNDSVKTSAQTTAAPSVKPQEKIKISYWGYFCGDIVDDNYCDKLIQDTLNIELETKKVDHTKQEQIDLMLASGDMPDCGWFTYEPSYLYKAQELTRLIPVDMIKKYAPSFLKTYDKFPILYKQVESNEDKNQHYCLAGHQAYIAGNQYFYSSFYRKDWLDKFGIKPATPMEEVTPGVFLSEKGFTLDQFAEIMKKFTTEDPDGNSKKDTVGMIGDQRVEFTWAPLLGAFGLVTSFNIEDNGKAAYYYATDRYKQFLNFVSKLYKDGYIDKEILTIDTQKCWEKAQLGYGGYMGISANWLGSWAATRPPLNILNNVKGSSILMTPGEIGSNGEMGTRMYSTTPLTQRFYINKNVTDDAKLAKILEFAEYTSYGPDRLKLQYGEEGKDFNMVDGQPVRCEGFKQGGEKGINSYSNWVEDEEVLDWINDKMFAATKKYTLGADALWNKYLVKPFKMNLTNDDDSKTAELAAKYVADCNAIVNQFFAKTVSGSVSVDAGWDGYIKSLNAAGYDKLIAAQEKGELYSELMKIK